jgi:hypothetical protein
MSTSANALALRCDASGDAMQHAHVLGVVVGSAMLRALSDGGRCDVANYEDKLREFIASSRRARDDARELLDFLRTRLEGRQRALDEIDAELDKMLETHAFENRSPDLDERLDALFPAGFDRSGEALPPCSICSRRFDERVVLSCGHSFCASCVRRSIEATGNRRSISCFACRRESRDFSRLYI